MNAGLASAARQLQSYGRGPDTMLAHITPGEAQFIDYMQGGRRVNPQTGLPEYGLFGKVLKGLARAAGAVVGFTLGGPAGAALGAGLATKATGGSWKQALTSGALSGLGGLAANWASGAGLGLTTGASYGPLAGAGAGAAGAAGGLAPGITEGTAAMLGSAGSSAASAAAPSFTSAALGAATSVPGMASGLGALSGGMRPSASKDDGPPSGFPQLRQEVTMQEIRDRLKASGFDPDRIAIQPDDNQYRYGAGPERLFFSPTGRGYAGGGPVAGIGGALSPMQLQALQQGYMMARKGGAISGPGGGKDDQIPAMLSQDENVWTAADVSALGDGSSNEGHRRMEILKQAVRKSAGQKNVKKPTGKQRGIGSMLAKAKAA